MSNILSRNRIAGMAVASLVAISLSASTAEAYQCKGNFIQAEAIHHSLAASRAAAKTSWHTKVYNTYNLQWSAWDIAASKTLNCSFTGASFYCIAKAKPCLYVVP